MNPVELEAARSAIIIKAFHNQDALNQAVYQRALDKANGQGPARWTDAGWPIYRALWTEAAEAVNYTNWFWWKFGQYQKPMSSEQVIDLHIELCDMLHFGLSMDFIRHTGGGINRLESQANFMAWVWSEQMQHELARPISEELEQVVVTAIQHKTFDHRHFARACKKAGLTLEGLLVFYFAKTALNHFRQENGYNDGTYLKMWNVGGLIKEDNFFLGRVIADYLSEQQQFAILDDLSGNIFAARIRASLSDLYSHALAANS